MRFRERSLTFSLLLSFLCLTLAIRGQAASPRTIGDQERVIVRDVDLIGQAFISAGAQLQGTEVGGLSGITYDPNRNVYYVVSDDRGERGPARFYTLSIDLAGNDLQAGDITLLGVTSLRDETDQPFASGHIDAEGISYAGDDRLYVASEGVASANPPIAPFVKAFDLDGQQIESFPIPAKFLPDGVLRGVRNNLAFESLALRPGGDTLFTATENALAQDGPPAGIGQSSHPRILAFDLAAGQAAGEWLYVTEPLVATPTPPDGEAINGLVELLALDQNGSLLALERSYVQGTGFSVRLYLARTQGALEVQSLDTLVGTGGFPLEIEPPVVKELLLDLRDLGLFIDNIEGMTFGPLLSDGRQSLILVSDNNFSPFLGSRFIALALTLDTIPAVRPARETVPFLSNPPTGGEVVGAASDPVIWLNPDDPGRSLIMVTAREGRLLALDLDGQIVQAIAAADLGDARFEQVDLLYQFPLAGQKADVVVATDGRNDTLAVWRIDAKNRRLEAVTSNQMPRPIFGSGENAAYLLAAYQSPVNGRSFVFVTQGRSGRIGQLALQDDGTGKVTAQVVRTIDLPAGSLPGGVVADRLLGDLYISLANEARILSFAAEPDNGDQFTTISLEEEHSLSGIDALTIYYGPGDTGYLLATSARDQSFVVINRGQDHEVAGRFILADDDALDQANYSVGIDVAGRSLGPDFPSGMAVVQDSADSPQNLVLEPGQARNGSSNFKLVPWERIAEAFPKTLLIDTNTFDPRYPMRNLLPLVIALPSGIE